MPYGQGSTRASRKARDTCLTRANHQCQLRWAGCQGLATIADHTINIATRGLTRAQAIDPDDLQAVCTSCHDVKTKRETAQASSAALKAWHQHREARRHLPTKPHPGD